MKKIFKQSKLYYWYRISEKHATEMKKSGFQANHRPEYSMNIIQALKIWVIY